MSVPAQPVAKLSCQCYRATAHAFFECELFTFQATSPKWQSENELWWTLGLAKTWLWGFHTAKCLIDIKRVLKGGKVNKERKGKYEECQQYLLLVVSARGELFSSELAVDLQLFAGCLSGETPGDTKRSIWPILLFYSSQNLGVLYNWLSGSQECMCVLQWCPKPCIPPNSSSVLLPGICCPSALQSGLAGAGIGLLGHAQPLASSGSVEQELGKQQLQLWLCLLPQVCHSCSPFTFFCLCWRALWTEAAPHHNDPLVWEWRPGVLQDLSAG